MAETTTRRRGQTAKAPARRGQTGKAPAAAKRAATGRSRSAQLRTTAGRTTDLSEDVLKSVESGQRAAIEAVHKFLDTVDEELPPRGEEPSRRQEVVDAALEMADRLVQTQYDFLRSVVHSAGKTVRGAAGKK